MLRRAPERISSRINDLRQSIGLARTVRMTRCGSVRIKGAIMSGFNLSKCACVLALLLFTGVAVQAEEEGLFGKQVQIDSSQVVPGSGQTLIAAFVPTGSDSEVCFVNLGDSGFYLGYFAPTTCIRRTFNGTKGLVVILSTTGWAMPIDFSMRVSVLQKGAKFYGQPIPFPL
jgi:hypothetical protein